MTLAIFMSGAAGLIFQIVWLYECGLVFGNSIWAATIVLSSFMGGLALGNALVALLDRRITPRPFLAYAALETIVGISGVALTYTLPDLASLIAPLTGSVAGHFWMVNAIRLAAAFAILVVPATAMGATLPVLVGALGGGPGRFGHVLGRLYGWNTLGALVGVVSAEVLIVNRLGVKGGAWIAAALDLGAAGISLWWSKRVDQTRTIGTPQNPPGKPKPGALKPATELAGVPGRLLASAFLAGCALLALEVVWFRFLTMYVLSTTLTVSLMLAVVLAAIGFGGLVASAWLKGHRPEAETLLAPVALTAGFVTVLSYVAFQWLTSGTQIAAWYRVLWLACTLAAPTSFVSGVFFTVLGDKVARQMGAAGGNVATRAAALLTLANTAGAMCGPPLAAFVMLPAIGIEGAFLALALTYAAVSGLALGRSITLAARLRSPAFVLASAALLIAVVRFPFGLMRSRYVLRSAQAYSGDGSEIVAIREGASDTIFLMQQKWMGKPVYNRLVTDGFSMSGTAVPGMRYMRYFAYWPMLLHKAPMRRALVVCYGVGVTAGAVTDIASLDSIDVVEISRDVLAMNDIIYESGRDPLRDPRVRLHVEDGRNFLQTSHDRFDLITGEPPPPRTPGAVGIYTREYFRLVYDRLAEGGMTTYWVPVARPAPGTDVDTIIRAFCDVFEDCSLWNGTPFDLMLVGTRHAIGPVSEIDFAKPWVTPGVESRLREVGFELPEEIGATFIGDAPYLRSLTATTPPLVDNYPQRLVPVPTRPSLSDPRYGSDPAVADFYQRVIDPASARQRFAASAFVRRLWPATLIAQTLPAFDDQRIVNRVMWEGGRPLHQIEDLHFLLTGTPLRTLPLWVLGSDEVKQRIAEGSADRTGVVEYAHALRALTGRDYVGAAAYFGQSEEAGLQAPTTRALRVYALCLAGRLDAARALAHGIRPADADQTHFWEWMSRTFGIGPDNGH